MFKNYKNATVAAIDPRRCSIGRHRKRKILLLSRHAGQAAPAGSRFDQVPATCLTDFFTFLSSFFASFQSGLKDSRLHRAGISGERCRPSVVRGSGEHFKDSGGF